MSLFLFYNECFMFFIYFCESRVNNNLTYMVKMKRLFLLCAFVSMFATCNFISAQKELGIFNSVSAGVGVGLTGVDVEVATPITPYLALRGGLTFMPGFSINTDVDVDVNDPRAGVESRRYVFAGDREDCLLAGEGARRCPGAAEGDHRSPHRLLQNRRPARFRPL